MGLFSSISKAASSLLGGSIDVSNYTPESSSFDPWTALAQGAVNVGSGMINNAYAISAAQRDYRYAKQLIDYQNEYNLPINQRKRLEDAGLNPNYILGGISSTSASGSASGGTGGRMDTPNLLAYQNMATQNELLRAQRNLTRDKSMNELTRYSKLSSEARIAGYNADYAEKEHELFEKTGKIPQSYYGNQNYAALIERFGELLLDAFL